MRLVIYVIVARAFLPGVLTDPPWNIAQYHDEHNFVMHDGAGYTVMERIPL